MRSFRDNAGREWTLSLTLGAERRVHAETDVYLSDISNAENPVLDRLANDPGFLGMVLVALCGPQVKERGVSEDDFLDAFDARVAADAREALIEEILDFLGLRGQAIREIRAERSRLVTEIEQQEVEATRGLTGRQALHLLERLLSRENSIATDGSAEASAELTQAA